MRGYLQNLQDCYKNGQEAMAQGRRVTGWTNDEIIDEYTDTSRGLGYFRYGYWDAEDGVDNPPNVDGKWEDDR